MQQEPRVSIGLPVYNAERYLEQNLDSVLSQTYKNFELIISDNASTDRTEEICRSYAARDSRVKYHRNQTNRGVTFNFKQVVLLSSGEYFLWIAHDDMFAPEYVERCVEVVDQNPGVILCYSKAIEIDEEGRELGHKEQVLGADAARPHLRFRELIRMDHNCESIFGMIRAAVLKKTSIHGNFPDSDRCVLAELGLYGTFHKLPEYYFYHREHRQRVTNQFPTRQERMRKLNPDRHLRVVFPHFRQLWEYISSIRRAPLRWRDRLRCYFEMLRWMRDNASRLITDLRCAMADLLRPLFRPGYSRLGQA